MKAGRGETLNIEGLSSGELTATTTRKDFVAGSTQLIITNAVGKRCSIYGDDAFSGDDANLNYKSFVHYSKDGSGT